MDDRPGRGGTDAHGRADVTAQLGLLALATAIAAAFVLLLPTETWFAIPVLIGIGLLLVARHQRLPPSATIAALGVVGSVSLGIGGAVLVALSGFARGGTFGTLLLVGGMVAIWFGIVGLARSAITLLREWGREQAEPAAKALESDRVRR